MVTCGDCKHWDQSEDMKEFNTHGEWGQCKAGTHDRGQDLSNETFTAVCFCEGIEGELMTRPQHACIKGDRK